MEQKIGMRIGIIGGGQLGMMLMEAAKPLGFAVTVLDKKDCPATFAGAHLLQGSITDVGKIQELGRRVDLVTVEIEHVETDALAAIEQEGISVHPSPRSLTIIKDKFAQKQFLHRHEFPTADVFPVDNESEAQNAAAVFGYPFLLKKRQGGFDGRGNAVIHARTDIAEAIQKFGHATLYAESHVSFVKELAVMVARGTTGDIATFPVVETIHADSVLRVALAPAAIDQSLSHQAEALARSIVKRLHGAGVFGIELFLTADGELLVNEIAPRVHNSGHFTIEACQTSQFTQHLLAISGQELGPTTMTCGAAVMVNILGQRSGVARPTGRERAEAIRNTAVHWYHKQEVVPLRKMGHITVTGDTVEACLEQANEALMVVSV